MSRLPLPKEVRPALGPLAEAVPLFFRIESLEVAGLHAVAVLGLETAWWAAPGLRKSFWQAPWGGAQNPASIAWEFVHALAAVAAVLLLVSVAAGDRGLQPRMLLRHFGALSLTAAMLAGVPAGVRVGQRWLAGFLGVDLSGLEAVWLLYGALPLGLTVWSAWFLGNAVRRRAGLAAARMRLLLWPGLLIAVPLGAFACDLRWEISRHFMGSHAPSPAAQFKIVCILGWTLLSLLAALWMLRVVENEAEADPAPNPTP